MSAGHEISRLLKTLYQQNVLLGKDNLVILYGHIMDSSDVSTSLWDGVPMNL